jgi:hypothetical protein
VQVFHALAEAAVPDFTHSDGWAPEALIFGILVAVGRLEARRPPAR